MTSSKAFLHIDDDSEDRSLLKDVLAEIDSSIEFLEAGDGKQGMAMLNAASSYPAVIFLDINMPVMDGWGFLNAFRANFALSRIPVIIYSTSSSERDIKKAFDMNADAFFVKPDDHSSMQNLLKVILSNLTIDLRSLLRSTHVTGFFVNPA